MIERQIIIGLIVSTEYLRKVKHIWNNDYIEYIYKERILNSGLKVLTLPIFDIEPTKRGSVFLYSTSL